MTQDTVKQYFAQTYPHLTDEELDRCCENLAAFVKLVLTHLEAQQLPTDHH